MGVSADDSAQDTSATCTHCGATISPGAKECQSCGVAFPRLEKVRRTERALESAGARQPEEDLETQPSESGPYYWQFMNTVAVLCLLIGVTGWPDFSTDRGIGLAFLFVIGSIIGGWLLRKAFGW